MKTMEIKELERIIESCEKAFQKIISELDNAIIRKDQVEESINKFNSKMEELREERQRILALGESPEAINQKIREAKDRHELEEDELVGLKRRIEDLNKERQRLINERRELRRDHLALQSIPLVKQFNEYAEKMGSIVSRLWKILDEMGEAHDQNRAFRASTWEALKVVPRLYLPWEGVKTLEDFFRRT